MPKTIGLGRGLDALIPQQPASEAPKAKEETQSGVIEVAVGKVLDQGFRTADIYTEGTKKVSTSEMGDAVVAALA